MRAAETGLVTEREKPENFSATSFGANRSERQTVARLLMAVVREITYPAKAGRLKRLMKQSTILIAPTLVAHKGERDKIQLCM
ncbi:hypothetical protein D3C73_1357980 [compost metagenome]